MDFDALISECVRSKASDLHISAGQSPFARIEGELLPIGKQELSSDLFREIEKRFGRSFPVLSDRSVDTLDPDRVDEDFSMDITLPDMSMDGTRSIHTHVRVRANYCVRLGKPSLTLRFVRPMMGGIDELGLPQILKQIAVMRRGIFLVTGPTGQGKTTTLAALIEEINANRRAKIVTVEDPIEYLFIPKQSLIWQREIGSDAKDFASALKYVLRQDPDIIMIGELRDLETISAAVTAAETGHLVLATLHTADAAQSIDRIVDVFPPHQQQQIRIQLAMSLVGICSQQLVPGMNGKRACAAEILLSNPAVRSSIREGKTAQIRTILQTNAALGMRTMDQALAELVRVGRIAREVAMGYAVEPVELQRLV